MYKYTHEEDGMYYLLDEFSSILWSGPQVAIGFSYDPENGSILHKHGSPDHVNAWAIATRNSFMRASKNLELLKSLNYIGVDVGPSFYEEMAKQITVVEGVFPIAEIIKCVETEGYIGIFYEKLQQGKVCCGKNQERKLIECSR